MPDLSVHSLPARTYPMEETRAEKKKNSTGNQKEVPRLTRFWKWLRKITWSNALMIIFTGVIAYSTLVYTQYAKRQWEVMGEQLKTANKSAEIASKTLAA